MNKIDIKDFVDYTNIDFNDLCYKNGSIYYQGVPLRIKTEPLKAPFGLSFSFDRYSVGIELSDTLIHFFKRLEEFLLKCNVTIEKISNKKKLYTKVNSTNGMLHFQWFQNKEEKNIFKMMGVSITGNFYIDLSNTYIFKETKTYLLTKVLMLQN
jgi:hypothetical protein